MRDNNHIALQEHVSFTIGAIRISLRLAKHFGDFHGGSTQEHS